MASQLNVDTIVDNAGTGAPDFPNGISVDVTGFSNAAATALGLKVYDHSGTYNGGGAPTLTGVSTTDYTAFIPYQVQDGSWRLKFNIIATQSAASSWSVTVNGVTFKDIGGNNQLSVNSRQSSGANSGFLSYATGNSGVLAAAFSGSNADIQIDGDVPLESKPTWAY